MFTALNVVSRVMLPSIGSRSSLQRNPLSQNAAMPANIDRTTYPHLQDLSPAIKSDHSTPLNEKYIRTTATRAETA